MRVMTMPVSVGSNPREVFADADPDAVLTVLLHKIAATATEEGASEGHVLLQSWLALLLAQYNLHILGATSNGGVQVTHIHRVPRPSPEPADRISSDAHQ